MNKHIIAMGWLMLLQAIPAFAQTTAPPNQRKLPLVAQPKDMSWRVAITSKTKEQETTQTSETGKFPPSGTLLHEENVLTGNLRKETRVYNDGSFTRYAKDSTVLYFDPRSNEVVVEQSSEDVPGGLFRASRFSECSWIKPPFHKGTEIYDGLTCDVYEAPWSGKTDNGDPVDEVAVSSGRSVPSQSVITAYIDQKTRLPVALVDPLSVRRYAFVPASNPVTLPKEFSDALKRVEAAINARRQRFNLEQ